MDEFRKADPIARLKILRWTLVASLVCFALVAWFLYFRESLIDWLLAHLEMLIENPWITWGFMILLLSPLIVFGLYLIKLGSRVMRAQEFPPPDMPVIRDTRILRGEGALNRAVLLKVTGIALILLCVIIANLFRLVFSSLAV